MSLFKLQDKEVQVKPSIDLSRYDAGLLAVIKDGFDGFLSVHEYFELEREIQKRGVDTVSIELSDSRKYQWTSDAWWIRGTDRLIIHKV